MPKSESRKYGSGGVAKQGDALDLQSRIFTWKIPERIGHPLKKSAEFSSRRGSPPGQPAISMRNFDEKWAEESLSAGHRRILDEAKEKFRALFSGESSEGAGEADVQDTTGFSR